MFVLSMENGCTALTRHTRISIHNAAVRPRAAPAQGRRPSCGRRWCRRGDHQDVFLRHRRRLLSLPRAALYARPTSDRRRPGLCSSAHVMFQGLKVNSSSAAALEVLHALCVAGEVERFGVDVVVVDPADVAVGQILPANLDVVLALQAEFAALRTARRPPRRRSLSSMPPPSSLKIWMAPSCAICSMPLTNCLRFIVSTLPRCARNARARTWGCPRTQTASSPW